MEGDPIGRLWEVLLWSKGFPPWILVGSVLLVPILYMVDLLGSKIGAKNKKGR